MPPDLVIGLMLRVKWFVGLNSFSLFIPPLVIHSMLYSFIPLVVLNTCCMLGFLLYSQSVAGTAQRLRPFSKISFSFKPGGGWPALGSQRKRLECLRPVSTTVASCLIKPKWEGPWKGNARMYPV